jgi:hypothetical protein
MSAKREPADGLTSPGDPLGGFTSAAKGIFARQRSRSAFTSGSVCLASSPAHCLSHWSDG